MDRLEMLKKAEQLARETVEGASSLTDKEYAELNQLNPDEAINRVASSILQAAAFHIEHRGPQRQAHI
jgi:hypothetical protein